MHHESTLDAEARRGLCEHLRSANGKSADELNSRMHGIRQRPEQVKHGAPLQLQTSLLGVLYSRMEQRSKKKSDTGMPDAFGHLRGRQIDGNTQSLQDVSATALAGYSAIPMFGHP